MSISSRSGLVCWGFGVIVIVVLFGPLLQARPKVDVIVLKNGDRLTCEIKKLERGQLHVKTEYTTGTVIIDWAEVDRLESLQLFEVELQDGRRYSGAIKEDPGDEKRSRGFEITKEESTTTVRHPEVIVLEQTEGNFWRRITGNVDYGYSFTSDQSSTQSTLELIPTATKAALGTGGSCLRSGLRHL